MIISASRRTDIPALYSEWLLNRLKAGFVMMPHPRSPERLGRVELSPEWVDCLVLWTKNPAPMLNRLSDIEAMGYCYYFQYTLTPYGAPIEPNLPKVAERVQTFAALSRRIGMSRMVWRYDPVLIDAAHTVPWHLERFGQLCGWLAEYTRRCVISFVDPYRGHDDPSMSKEEMLAIAAGFSAIAGRRGMRVETCAEAIDLSGYGIGHGACIDAEHIGTLLGCPVTARKDTGQRPACRCIESVDIGAYGTCVHGCAYCYATSSLQAARRRFQAHDPAAPMLTGYPSGREIITERTAPSCKERQLRFL